AVGELSDVEKAVAESAANMSIGNTAYEYGTDADEFERSIDTALDDVSLPEDAEPNVMPGGSPHSPILYLTASSPEQHATELSATLTDTVVPRLENIAGVRSADVSGAATERVEITPDQQALAENGLTPEALSEALEENGITMPLGSVSGDHTTLPVDGGSEIDSLDDIKELPLSGQPEAGQDMSDSGPAP